MNPNKLPKIGVLQAAGGLLWRFTNGNKELALVHRPIYDDWTLPKGMLIKKESFQEAALREVFEETGCHASLGPLAGCTCYQVYDFPKIVIFWNMILIEQEKFEPNDEVDAVIWLAADQACERLSYANERSLVEKNMMDGAKDGKS